ncbi:MBL fold metallo-hydrolase [Halobacteriales archaeon SW_7_71_33]|nr:MAG: MBL fold metallo-hydrolase [Halobacteriales archaeon SW_7_71_33]
MEIADGVHTLPLTFERDDRELTLHPAAVETRHGAVLVDAGLPGGHDQLRGQLDDVGVGLSGVHDLFLTHQDGDHVGGAPGLLSVDSDSDIDVVAHRTARPYVEGDRDPAKGDPENAPDPVGVDLAVVDGVRFATRAGPMEVIHTPGHTPGHVSLHLPEADLLLAADAVVSEAGRLLGPSERHSADLEAAHESVARLSELTIDRVLCYHGGVAEQGSDRLATIADAELTG